jgi:hypothetical protein
MIEQFGRVARLVLGSNGNGVDLSGLRIRFTITKTSDSSANEAKIEVYNTTPEHAALFIKVGTDILLMAGYEGNEQMIFTGQVRRGTRHVEGTDRILLIESGDGDQAIDKATVNKTLEKGCTNDDVAKECQSAMGVPTGHADKLDDKPHTRGKTVSGKASKVMDKVIIKHEAQWSIQDGQLVMLKGSNTRPNAVWLISDSTGMLGSPEETEDGVKVTTLLNPAYLIGGVAKIESAYYNAGIRIEKIEHAGDTHGAEWSSKLEGTRA